MRIIDLILNVIFPEVCICCNRVLPYNSKLPFCKKCNNELFTFKQSEAKPLGSIYVERTYCLYRYDNFEIKSIIFHAKNIFSKKFGEFIATEMAEKLKKHNLLNQIEVITYAPRKKSSIRKFGFDQGKEIARYLSVKTGIPYEDLIIRKGKSNEQKFLTSREREENVKNIFHFNKEKHIENKTVLIVDDVITTGATIKTCSKALKDNGAKLVFAMSIAD